MDKDNPILKLIHEGSALEKEQKLDEAHQLFLRAWNNASNHQEKCIAAHFVARNQKTPEESLRWNKISLEEADQAGKDKVKEYYPSLYVNLGLSYENLGNIDEAKKFYDLALSKIDDLPTDEANIKYNQNLKDIIDQKRRSVE